jgi:hypothetical protein
MYEQNVQYYTDKLICWNMNSMIPIFVCANVSANVPMLIILLGGGGGEWEGFQITNPEARKIISSDLET